MKLVIEGDQGRKSVVPVRDEMTIGRDDGNTVRLPDRNISRRHARLFQENGKLLIEDLRSFNGVRVNGRTIDAATEVKEGDLIELGDYELSVEGTLDEPSSSKDTVPVAEPISHPAAAVVHDSDEPDAPKVELRDLDPTQTPRLFGLCGPVRGKEFYLTRTEVNFGRGSENDLAVDHQSVSRAHARFVLHGGHWKVVDNQSANGIRVNGEDYAVGVLTPGDTIELGHLKFRFCGPGEKFSLPETSAGTDPARPEAPEMIGGEDPQVVDKRASSAVRIATLAMVLLTALAAASWFFGRRGATHARARHGETAPFARAPISEPAPGEGRPAAKPQSSANAERASKPAAIEERATAHPAAPAVAPPVVVATPPATAPAPETAPAGTAAPAEAKEAQATRLATASNEKLNAHDFEGAVSDAQAALDLAPQSRDTLCTAYHSLGYGFSYLNDNRSAKKYLEQFKPCCAKFGETACAQVDEFLAR